MWHVEATNSARRTNKDDFPVLLGCIPMNVLEGLQQFFWLSYPTIGTPTVAWTYLALAFQVVCVSLVESTKNLIRLFRPRYIPCESCIHTQCSVEAFSNPPLRELNYLVTALHPLERFFASFARASRLMVGLNAPQFVPVAACFKEGPALMNDSASQGRNMAGDRDMKSPFFGLPKDLKGLQRFSAGKAPDISHAYVQAMFSGLPSTRILIPRGCSNRSQTVTLLAACLRVP